MTKQYTVMVSDISSNYVSQNRSTEMDVVGLEQPHYNSSIIYSSSIVYCIYNSSSMTNCTNMPGTNFLIN